MRRFFALCCSVMAICDYERMAWMCWIELMLGGSLASLGHVMLADSSAALAARTCRSMQIDFKMEVIHNYSHTTEAVMQTLRRAAGGLCPAQRPVALQSTAVHDKAINGRLCKHWLPPLRPGGPATATAAVNAYCPTGRPTLHSLIRIPTSHSPVPLSQGTLFRYGTAAANVAFMTGRHPRHVVLIGGLTDGLLFAKYAQPLATRLEAQQWSLVQALLSSSHNSYGLSSLDQDADELHALAQHLKAEYGSQVGVGWVCVGWVWVEVLVGGVAQWHTAAASGTLLPIAAGMPLGRTAPQCLHLLPRASPLHHALCACQQGVVICGHSTGCQDAVRYAQRYRASGAAAPLLGVVLQAPVSDVEWLATQVPAMLLPPAADVQDRSPQSPLTSV